jgi:hypothetical protein
VSLRSSLWRYLGLLAIAALAVGIFAGPASAKKMSAKQRAAIRAQLRKEVKKNPKAINRKSFLKRASLVNFRLPVTIRLRDASAATNPNSATVDLGTSLGKRTVNLGGSLAANIVFHDSYDGGALGNVDLEILGTDTARGAAHQLSSTSIPILWNDQVTQSGTSWDSTLLKFAGLPASYLNSVGHNPGCADVNTSASNSHYGNFGIPTNPDKLRFGVGAINAAGGVTPPLTGLPGVPIYADLPAALAHSAPTGFAAASLIGPTSGLDNSIDAIKASGTLTGAVTDNNNVGANTDPFPGYGASSVPGPNQASDARNTVLRTNALKLGVAPVGTPVNQSIVSTPEQVSGSQNQVMGKSGGQANLFGNIPGKSYGIDVTVNLATRINSIIRVVDQDANEPLVAGGDWPAAVFSCAQIWTGGIDNYIPAVRLSGNLKIAPAITADGKLRIAKASVTSLPGSAARFAVAACLMPKQSYNAEIAGQDKVPTPSVTNQDQDLSLKASAMPADANTIAPPPAAGCNTTPSPLVANSALGAQTVNVLTGGTNPSVTDALATGDGSSASVGADLSVQNVSLDVLLGDV